MVRRGRRSHKAAARRREERENHLRLHQQLVFSRQLVGKEAHRDTRKKEVVNTLLPHEVFFAVKKQFGFVVTGLSWREQGEVMADSRGAGSLQRLAVY